MFVLSKLSERYTFKTKQKELKMLLDLYLKSAKDMLPKQFLKQICSTRTLPKTCSRFSEQMCAASTPPKTCCRSFKQRCSTRNTQKMRCRTFPSKMLYKDSAKDVKPTLDTRCVNKLHAFQNQQKKVPIQNCTLMRHR